MNEHLCVVQVAPNASKTRLLGWKGEVLRIAVAAPRERGKANKELIRFVSRLLGCKRDEVVILRGETSRKKLMRIECSDISPLMAGRQEKLV